MAASLRSEAACKWTKSWRSILPLRCMTGTASNSNSENLGRRYAIIGRRSSKRQQAVPPRQGGNPRALQPVPDNSRGRVCRVDGAVGFGKDNAAELDGRGGRAR